MFDLYLAHYPIGEFALSNFLVHEEPYVRMSAVTDDIIVQHTYRNATAFEQLDEGVIDIGKDASDTQFLSFYAPRFRERN